MSGAAEGAAPRRRGLLALLALAAWPLPARAHHGFGGRYDAAGPIWLEGMVERAAFAPPHPVLVIRVDPAARAPEWTAADPELPRSPVTRPEHAGRAVDVEFPPIGVFFGLRDQLRAGQRVAVVALRNCLPPHQLRSQWIRLPTGRVVSRAGRMSSTVAGCDAA